MIPISDKLFETIFAINYSVSTCYAIIGVGSASNKESFTDYLSRTELFYIPLEIKYTNDSDELWHTAFVVFNYGHHNQPQFNYSQFEKLCLHLRELADCPKVSYPACYVGIPNSIVLDTIIEACCTQLCDGETAAGIDPHVQIYFRDPAKSAGELISRYRKNELMISAKYWRDHLEVATK